MSTRLLVVGAGAAGARGANVAVKESLADEVHVISGEAEAPYYRCAHSARPAMSVAWNGTARPVSTCASASRSPP